MGRIRTTVEVAGVARWALFDSGSRNTYVVREAVRAFPVLTLAEPQVAKLGGEGRAIKEISVLEAKIEGHPVTLEARILDEIGTDEAGKAIDLLVGALAMQQWGIRLVPEEERLDMTHYPREFVEF